MLYLHFTFSEQYTKFTHDWSVTIYLIFEHVIEIIYLCFFTKKDTVGNCAFVFHLFLDKNILYYLLRILIVNTTLFIVIRD